MNKSKEIMKHIILISTILLVFAQAHSQDPGFTQFYSNPLYLNPALVGAERCPRLVMNYRNQWPTIDRAYVTYASSLDARIKALHGGLGLQVVQDIQGNGTIKTSSFSGIYAYDLQINKNFALKAGFQATFQQRRLDWEKLYFGDQIDTRKGFIYATDEVHGRETIAYPDFSSGIVAYSKYVYAGIAAHHLTQPKEQYLSGTGGKLYRKYTAHAGVSIPFEKYNPGLGTFSPNIVYQQQGGFRQLNVGMSFTRKLFTAGMWYRHGESIILLAGLHHKKFKLAYSYDINFTSLRRSGAGAHELAFIINFNCPPRKSHLRRELACPSIL